MCDLEPMAFWTDVAIAAHGALGVDLLARAHPDMLAGGLGRTLVHRLPLQPGQDAAMEHALLLAVGARLGDDPHARRLLHVSRDPIVAA